jgi:pimeloyl-ACP methyl ester carboxylesterase
MFDRLRVALSVLISLGLCACAASDEPKPGGETAKQPTIGRVDVGGYELAWMCRGSGSPTIIAEAGYDSAGTDTWFDLLDPLSMISRVCTYDRAGTGTSDDRPNGMHVTGMLEAEELNRLLVGAGIDPPYVVVGHSYGGFVSRLFGARYRGDVAGLVLVDSSHEEEIEPYRRYYGDSPEGDWVDWRRSRRHRCDRERAPTDRTRLR